MMGYENARQAQSKSHKRCIENWRLYTAHNPELGLGQYPEEAAQQLLEQKRQLVQYNITRVIVDTIAGGIMQVPFDPEFYPVNSKITSLTHAVKKAMYSDKEILDWNASYFEMVRAGLIHEGVIKMYVNYDYDPLGNIGFKNALPGSVIADPLWKTWSSKDCKVCWQETFHTVEELMDIYPEQKDMIAIELARKSSSMANKIQPTEYGTYYGPTPYMNTGGDNKWGSQHKLVQEYRIIERTVNREYATTVDGDILIPEELKNPAEKIQWLNSFHPTWNPLYVYVKPEKEKTCIVTAVVPSISYTNIFECRPTEIQIGRLPFFWWSASRENGESSSIVDSVKDAQMNLNYLSGMIIYKWQVEGGGGSQFADRTLFADDSVWMDYINNRNDPTKVFETRAGALEEGKTPAVPTRKSEFPREAYEAINHLLKMILPQISKVTPASRGQTEGNVDSGKLFELMKIQSDQQVYTIHYGLRIVWNEIYEAYFMQASKTYAKEKLPREFAFNMGKESITLNERIVLPDGSVGIKNDVSMLNRIRHKVIISEKQESPTQRMETLSKISMFIKSLPQGKPATAQILINEAAKLMDILGEEQLEILDAVGQEEVGLVLQEIRTKKAQLQIEELNATQQLKALMAQYGMAEQAAPGGAGMPGAQNEQEQIAAAMGQQPPAPPTQLSKGTSVNPPKSMANAEVPSGEMIGPPQPRIITGPPQQKQDLMPQQAPQLNPTGRPVFNNQRQGERV